MQLYLFLINWQVPVRVAGGLLFELLGQSVGDPFVNEDDLPIVLRSWQTQNFLVTALHVKGFASNVNVLGITEVQVCGCQCKFCKFQFLSVFTCKFICNSVSTLEGTVIEFNRLLIVTGAAYCWG